MLVASVEVLTCYKQTCCSIATNHTVPLYLLRLPSWLFVINGELNGAYSVDIWRPKISVKGVALKAALHGITSLQHQRRWLFFFTL